MRREALLMPHFLFHFLISGAIKYQETRSEEKMNGKLKCKQNHLSHLIPMPHTRVQLKSARMKIQKSNCFAMKKRARAQTKKSAMLIFSPQSNRWRDLNCCQSENANEFDPSGEITFYSGEREAIELNKMEKKWSLICQFIVRIKKTSSFFAGLSTMKESFLWGTVQP